MSNFQFLLSSLAINFVVFYPILSLQSNEKTNNVGFRPGRTVNGLNSQRK